MIDTFENAVREETAEIIGFEVSDTTWAEMFGRAKRKLHHIITNFGDADGARNTVNYIAQLTAEAIKEQAFSDYCMDLYQVRKSKGADANANPQGHTDIILQDRQKSQACRGVTA